MSTTIPLRPRGDGPFAKLWAATVEATAPDLPPKLAAAVEARDGKAAAPDLVLGPGDIDRFQVTGPFAADGTAPTFRLRGTIRAALTGDGFELLSGALALGRPADPGPWDEMVKRFWPGSDPVNELLLGPSGADVLTGRHRFRLVAVDGPPDRPTRAVWQNVSATDHSALRATLAEAEQAPFRVIDPVGRAADAAAFVHVTYENGTPTGSFEVIRPTWGFAISGADWFPGRARVNNDRSDLRFADGDATDPWPSDDEKALRLTWRGDEVTADNTPDLLSTGETTAAAANRPYFWQLADLTVGDRNEPHVWVRYRLDALPAAADPTGAVAGSLLDGRVEVTLPGDWRLEVGLRPSVPSPVPRVRLAVELAGNRVKSAALALVDPRVRARSPAVRGCHVRLPDPAGVPNAADPSSVVRPDARLVFADDRRPSPGRRAGVLRAKIVGGKVELEVAVAGLVSDTVTAFVPGPLAGIEVPSWAGRNAEPTLPPGGLPTAGPRPRDYTQGLVAVGFASAFSLASGGVRVNQVTFPETEVPAALLPWAAWAVGQDQMGYAIRPYHRNLILDDIDREEAVADRGPPPADVPVLMRQPSGETAAGDFRRVEAVTDLRRAVRDRYARATGAALSRDGTAKGLTNWLEGVTLDQGGGAAGWELAYKPAEGVDGYPALTARLGSAGEQQLHLDGTEKPGWLRTHLRWGPGGDDAPPKLTVEEGTRRAAVPADAAAVPPLFQRAGVTAMAAEYLDGRLWVFFALEPAAGTGEVHAWEPFRAGNPYRLKQFNLPGPVTILQAREDPNGVVTVVACSGRQFQFVQLVPGATEDEPLLPKDAGNPMTAAAAAADVAAVTITKDFLVVAAGAALEFRPLTGVATVANALDCQHPVTATAFRAMTDDPPKSSFLAVATRKSPGAHQVRLYKWKLSLDSTPDQGPDQAGANKTPLLAVSHSDGLTLSALDFQPFPVGSADGAPESVRVFAALSTPTGAPGQLVEWEAELGATAPSVDPVPGWLGVGRPDLPAGVCGLALDRVTDRLSDTLVAFLDAAPDGRGQFVRWDLRWSGTGQAGPAAATAADVRRVLAHRGQVTVGAVVPGGPFAPAANRSYGTLVVTGGPDGVVGVWDPRSCQELRRHAPARRWLDVLGIVRPPRPAFATDPSTGFWVERVRVPEEAAEVLRLSADRVSNALLNTNTGTHIGFVCSNLPLVERDGEYQPAGPGVRARLADGVFAFVGPDAGHPTIYGVRIVVTELLGVTFEGGEVVTWGQAGPRTIRFRAVLANPARPAPDPTVALTDDAAESVARGAGIDVTLRHVGGPSGGYELTELRGSFFWRFNLAVQTPAAVGAAFPGRLAVLGGSAENKDGAIVLTPRAESSRAEAFGRLWQVAGEFPPLVADRAGGQTVYREGHVAAPGALAFHRQLTGGDGVSAVTAFNRGDGRAEVLIGFARGSGGRAVLVHPDAPSPAVRFDAGVGHARFVIRRQSEQVSRLEAVLRCADGTIRVRSIATLDTTSESAVSAVVDREVSRFAPSSPPEALEVFDDGSHRLYLFRCQDGTARLWDGLGTERFRFLIPDAVVTAVGFGPAVGGRLGALRHWKPVLGSAVTVAAVGGSDGSVRVYAITANDAPRVVATFTNSRTPVVSIALAEDPLSVEAGRLLGGGRAEIGLALLVCSEGAPPALYEVLSGRRVPELDTVPELAGAPPAVGGTLVAFQDKLTIVLHVREEGEWQGYSTQKKKKQDGEAVKTDLTPFREFGSRTNRPPVRTTLAAGRPGDLPGDLYLATCSDTGTSAHLSTNGEAFSPVSLPDVVGPNGGDVDAVVFGGVLRLLGVTSDARAGCWAHNGGSLAVTAEARPTAVRAGGLTTLPVPLVTAVGGPWAVWDPDMARPRYAYPAEFDPARLTPPPAIATLDGRPYLATVENDVVGVWDLSAGRLFRQLIHTRPVEEVDLANQDGKGWVLIRDVDGACHLAWIPEGRDHPPITRESRFNPLPLAGGTAAAAAFVRGPTGFKAAAVTRGADNKLGFVSWSLEVPVPAAPTTSFTTTVVLATDKKVRSFDHVAVGNKEWCLFVADTKLVVADVTGQKLLALAPDSDTTAVAAFDLARPPNVVSVRDSGVPRFWAPDGVDKLKGADLLPNAPPGPGAPTAVATYRVNDGTRVAVTGKSGYAVLDVPDQGAVEHVRSVAWDDSAVWDDKVAPAPRVCRVNVPAAVTATDKRVQVWDAETGHLRHEFSHGAGEKVRLAAVRSGERPLVVAGGKGVIQVFDLLRGADLGNHLNRAGEFDGRSLDATHLSLVLEGSAWVRKTVPVVAATAADKLLVWVGGGDQPLDPINDPTPDADLVCLLPGPGFAVVAAASGGVVRLFHAWKALEREAVLLVKEVGAGAPVTALALATGTTTDRVTVAAAVAPSTAAGGASVALFDLPVGNDLLTPSPAFPSQDLEPEGRPHSAWRAAAGAAGAPVAAACSAAGPVLIAGAGAHRPEYVLRVRAAPETGELSPTCQLRINFGKNAVIDGLVTAARGLDLRLDGLFSSLGIDPKECSVRPSIIQDRYYGFLLEAADRAPFVGGGLVVWEEAAAGKGQRLRGLIVVEDHEPAAAAVVRFPGQADGEPEWTGPRIRVRSVGFDTTSEPDGVHEVVTWRLAGGNGRFLLLSDQFLGPGTTTALARLVVTVGDDPIEGEVPVAVERRADDTYRLTVLRTVFAVEKRLADDSPDPVRADILLPDGPSLRAYDLTEARRGPDTTTLATLAVRDGHLGLFEVPPEAIPLDLAGGRDVFAPMPKQPLTVPQLTHRLGHGGRLRSRLPDATDPVTVAGAEGAKVAGGSLIHPIVRGPLGAVVLVETVVVRDPKGRPVTWEGFVTAGVFAVHQRGGTRFAPRRGQLGEAASVVNLMTGTVAVGTLPGATSAALLDDDRIRDHVRRTGASGVLLARRLMADGRVVYRFVPSPFYATDPPLPVHDDPTAAGASPALVGAAADEDPPPTPLAPAAVRTVQFDSGPGYDPVPAAGAGQRWRIVGHGPGSSDTVFVDEATAFAQRPPAGVTAVGGGVIAEGTPFRPTEFEFTAGGDKPGAIRHQMVRCRRGRPGPVVLGPAADLGHREPLALGGPAGAGLAARVTLLKNGRLEVAWTELLGTVPIGGVTATAVTVTAEGSPLRYGLGSPDALFRLIVRVGEAVFAIGPDATELIAPLSAVQTPGYEVFLVTRVADLFADVPVTAGGTDTARPFAAVLNSPTDLAAVQPLQNLFAPATSTGDVRVYRATPEFVRLVAGRGAGALFDVFWAKPVDGAFTLAGPPKPAPWFRTSVPLRAATPDPQTPRLYAVVRVTGSTHAPLFEGIAKCPERTLFYGESASARGVEPTVTDVEFTLTAADTETVSAPAGDQRTVFLVKVFRDGSVLAQRARADGP